VQRQRECRETERVKKYRESAERLRECRETERVQKDRE
jgi:hypothetical protein